MIELQTLFEIKGYSLSLNLDTVGWKVLISRFPIPPPISVPHDLRDQNREERERQKSSCKTHRNQVLVRSVHKKMFKIHRCPCRLLEHFPPLHYAYLGHPDLVCNKHVLLITAQSKYTPQRQLSACRHNKTLPHTMLSALLYFFFLHFLSSFFSSFSSSMYIAPTEIYCQFFILYFLIFCNEIWSQGSQKCYFHVLSWFYIWSSTFISNMKSLQLFGFSFC